MGIFELPGPAEADGIRRTQVLLVQLALICSPVKPLPVRLADIKKTLDATCQIYRWRPSGQVSQRCLRRLPGEGQAAWEPHSSTLTGPSSPAYMRAEGSFLFIFFQFKMFLIPNGTINSRGGGEKERKR